MIRRKFCVSLSCIVMLTLAACGKKGPLYVPSDKDVARGQQQEQSADKRKKASAKE